MFGNIENVGLKSEYRKCSILLKRGNQSRPILKWNLYVVHRTFIFQIVKNKLTLNCYNIKREHVIRHYYISMCT